MTQDNLSDFEKRRDELIDNIVWECECSRNTQCYGCCTRASSKAADRAYNKGFTDPLVEAMERALESAKDEIMGCAAHRTVHAVDEINSSLDAYRAAKAKLKGSGE